MHTVSYLSSKTKSRFIKPKYGKIYSVNAKKNFFYMKQNVLRLYNKENLIKHN